MKLNLITRDTVKTYLGIADSSYDTEIDRYIPIVSSDIRSILNTNFDTYVSASYADSATSIILPDFRGYKDINGTHLPNSTYWVGQVLQGVGIPDDTYLTEYDPLTDIFTLSDTTTAAGVYVYPTLKISQWASVSKMVFYRIGKETTSDVTAKGVESEKYGPVSIKYTESEINKQWDYPQVLIDDLGIPFQGVH
jgi:hypothetical protein